MSPHRLFMLRAQPMEPGGFAGSAPPIEGPPRDRRGRALTDLRLSLTDRCNFRCAYCMPREKFPRRHAFLPRAELLDFDEITRVARVFVAAGVRTLRLTGGEPLLRKDVERLVARLRALDPADGPSLDLAMTSNGSLLATKARSLRSAGLDRLTVSLDALDDRIFRRMNDVDFGVAPVLEGIDAAFDAGFPALKVNMVVRRGVNEQEIVPLASYLRDRYGARVELRFIEYMDVGSSNGWATDQVLPSADVIALLQRHFPLERTEAVRPSATASRWRYRDGRGHVGTIASVSEPFCGDCSRARLSSDGQLYTCLFATQGHDLRSTLRGPDPHLDADERLARLVHALWRARGDNYSERRAGGSATGHAPVSRRVEMHYIGG